MKHYLPFFLKVGVGIRHIWKLVQINHNNDVEMWKVVVMKMLFSTEDGVQFGKIATIIIGE